MLDSPTTWIPEGTKASCYQAPKYAIPKKMMYAMGYNGYGCGTDEQGIREPIPTPHFKTDKYDIDIRPYGAHPFDINATSS
ncbi:hypothetical protein KI387_029633, partial [Taxus chinensis]